MPGRLLLGATIFTSAFLLFQVQPVLGKFILPWFGSSPGVWSACLCFFQTGLLGGYAYAHLLVSRLAPRRQIQVHAALLLGALLTLPVTPHESWKPSVGESSSTAILGALAASVGLPFVLLSATGPLFQSWYARTNPERSPYRLYALSNMGSLLALFTYPFLVEPALRLREQTELWSWTFGLFVLLALACSATLRLHSRGAAPVAPVAQREGAPAYTEPWPPSAVSIVTWFLLAACGSTLLLATTDRLCLDMAVVPFLWVLPLGLYLLSYILAFEGGRFYVRPLFCGLLAPALVHVLALLHLAEETTIPQQVVGYSLALFVACMCCHGELYRARPAARSLTLFYLVVAAGGATGGFAVAFGAPVLLDGFHELPLLLLSCFILVMLVLLLAPERSGRPRAAADRAPLLRTVAWGAGLVLTILSSLWLLHGPFWPGLRSGEDGMRLLRAWRRVTEVAVWTAPLCLLLLAVAEVRRHRAEQALGVGSPRGTHVSKALGAAVVLPFLLALSAAVGWRIRGPEQGLVARGRNFHGVLRIREYERDRDEHDWTLEHGNIMHGFQYRRQRTWPTAYYAPQTGVGIALRTHPERFAEGRQFRIGVVGLGVGTLAAYANARVTPEATSDADYVRPLDRRPPDYVRFYEINPLVVEWAREEFTFLADARGRGADVDVYTGDARIVLERQLADGVAQRFDVLVLDAFSSDAIPLHLLTIECLALYWEHLAVDGVLAIHVTNRFIDLVPVLRRPARELGKELFLVDSYDDDDGRGLAGCDWLLMTANSALCDLGLAPVGTAESEDEGPAWTDDYTSILPLLDLGGR